MSARYKLFFINKTDLVFADFFPGYAIRANFFNKACTRNCIMLTMHQYSMKITEGLHFKTYILEIFIASVYINFWNCREVNLDENKIEKYFNGLHLLLNEK